MSKPSMNRRQFVGLGALQALALVACGGRRVAAVSGGGAQPLSGPKGFGPLASTAGRVLDLPTGFHCAVIQRFHDTMSCGNRVPQQPDGMCCHINELGQYVLLRNHEIKDHEFLTKLGNGIPSDLYAGGRQPTEAYNSAMHGGVTRVVLDPVPLEKEIRSGAISSSLISSNLALTGTVFNCSGGKVPQGWITCEETDHPGHGFAFLTRISDDRLAPARDRRIDSWGRLKREGVSVDAETGLVYMTEDHSSGCLYRFVPADRDEPMGIGSLQALSAVGMQDSDPTENLVEGSIWDTNWVPINDPLARDSPCREQAQTLQATRFNRCEGSVIVGDCLWFIASTAGPAGAGQVFKLNLSTGRLSLEVQVTDRSVLSMPDNLTLSPWGDLLMAEDNYNSGGGATHQYVRGLTEDGTIYDFARNPVNGPEECGAELTGPCFSPDGKVMFLNIQRPIGATVAITGPWPWPIAG